jgi:hypothetical protein
MNKLSQENIRSPDETKRETLLNNNSTFNEDEELNSVLLKSIQEEEEYYDNQLNNIRELIKKRTPLIENINFTLKRIGTFDKNIQEIYELIEYIIDSYCGGTIDFYKYDQITYTKIMNGLAGIRFSSTEMDLLRQIIRREEE